MERDDFPVEIKRTLGARAGYRCSNPNCATPTAGPQLDPERALNLGVAAHITAAAPGGARFDPTMTKEQRAGIDNAIWLCQNCAKLVDNDPARFTPHALQQYKKSRETAAQSEIGRTNSIVPDAVKTQLEAHRHGLWTIRAYGRRISDPRPLPRDYRERAEGRIEEIAPLYVRLLVLSSSRRVTIPLGDITISYDEDRYRPMIEIRARP